MRALTISTFLPSIGHAYFCRHGHHKFFCLKNILAALIILGKINSGQHMATSQPQYKGKYIFMTKEAFWLPFQIMIVFVSTMSILCMVLFKEKKRHCKPMGPGQFTVRMWERICSYVLMLLTVVNHFIVHTILSIDCTHCVFYHTQLLSVFIIYTLSSVFIFTLFAICFYCTLLLFKVRKRGLVFKRTPEFCRFL